MTGETPTPLPALLPDDDLLRVLRSRAEEQDYSLAFFLRGNERDSGLSVRFRCTYDQCRADFRSSYGVLGLKVGFVLDIPLAVEPDTESHANIKGLPHKDDDERKATYLARRLAEGSILVDSGKYERP
jgi:hypothetical protein